jgi:gamma-glutamyltranspeptidase/glutathione hydrolase
MPPPSSGGIALIQMLSMLDWFNIKENKFLSVEYIHLLAEIEKLAYADRSKYLGDPDFVNIPINLLLDREYLLNRKKQIKPGYVTPSNQISPGQLYQESEQTTHFSIVDSRGNAVSLTTTINSGFGSKIFVSGAGFLLNNEMDDFSSKPGVANQFGLIGDSANAIEPGKRMLSSMTPTIIEKNNELFLITGSPGGATIITSVLQTTLGVMYFKLNLQESINAPRFHHQWLPDLLYLEKGRFDTLIINQLIKMGYKIEEREPIGRVDAILILENGKKEGGADPRGDDKAGGY